MISNVTDMIARTVILFVTLHLSLSLGFAQKQGAELLKTDILSVLAHPDDETGMASTMAYYAHERDAIIAHAYCTRGEGGGNMVGTHWGSSLGVLREIELKQCLDTLGVKHCFFLDQLDWAYTESAAMTLEKWDKEKALGDLVRLVRSLRPEVILTMNPFPRAGQHGHHQAAGMLGVEAFTAAADPTRYPDQLKREGLSVWQTRKLYFRGESVGTSAKIDCGQAAHEIAGEALRNHRSQGFGRFQRASLGRPPETFGLVKSVISVVGDETDLLAGLPLPLDSSPTLIQQAPAKPTGFEFKFQPRPAVSRFLKWAEEQQIRHLVDKQISDLSVVAGQENKIVLEVIMHDLGAPEISISLEAQAGWTLSRGQIEGQISPQTPIATKITITPPIGATEDVILIAKNELTGTQVEATLHPVPTTSIPRISGLKDDQFLQSKPLLITHTQKVQGKSDNDADSSGEVRLGYDERFLYVDTLVLDDVVVSNIAPNDIRGHWRSDAIEICVDPTASSEHTLTCFKVGIFPFDSSGTTRAARDADANQGPIEETAPGMTVSAIRLENGYRVTSAIPWKAIGIDSPTSGAVIGFNLLLYDGDKADAAPGENINESRLAWAPRRSVQGRPEDWGRVRLD
ncbi:MAG: LmbE family N-acetylglucosaminyl deacetylase [Verrucomicrobiales bacterium]|jgi:LmbE family N-acetylglucosaminyl deacetylase